MATTQPLPFATVHRKLAKQDPRLAPLIERVGPCTLSPNPDAFVVLACSIISQQISTKAADSIRGRVVTLCGKKGLKPATIAAHNDPDLRACGLSSGKLLSLRSLSEYFLANTSVIRRLKTMPDDEVIETLLPIRGVGPWTAQMFLMFSLGRPDVLPVADLGFRAGVKDHFNLDDLPGATELDEMSQPWKPYRSVATWYFWRSRGGVPQSD